MPQTNCVDFIFIVQGNVYNGWDTDYFSCGIEKKLLVSTHGLYECDILGCKPHCEKETLDLLV